MKKLLLTILSIVFMPVAYGDGTANIDIKITGATPDNRYFLCIPNVGCLSILAAQRGKIYPVYSSFEMSNVYIANVTNERLSGQSGSGSCETTVNTGQTIKIYGHIAQGPNGSAYVTSLHCSLEGGSDS